MFSKEFTPQLLGRRGMWNLNAHPVAEAIVNAGYVVNVLYDWSTSRYIMQSDCPVPAEFMM